MNYYDKLNEEIKVRVLSHNNFKYISASDVRDRLNKVFDCKWSFIVTECKVDEDIVIIRAKISVDLDGYLVTKESFGTGEIRRYTGGANKGKPVDVGNAYQTAVADSLKSCAKMLGIGNKINEFKNDIAEKDSKTKITTENKNNKIDDVKAKIDKLKASNADEKNPGNNKEDSKKEEIKTKLAKIKSGNKKDEDNVENKKSCREKIRAKLARKANRKSSDVSENEGQGENEEVDVIGGSGFIYSNDTQNTLEIKKMILDNFAVNKGISVNNFIKETLGEGVTLDNITEEQISNVISGTMSDAVGS